MFTATYLLTAKKPNEPHFFQWVNSYIKTDTSLLWNATWQ